MYDAALTDSSDNQKLSRYETQGPVQAETQLPASPLRLRTDFYGQKRERDGEGNEAFFSHPKRSRTSNDVHCILEEGNKHRFGDSPPRSFSSSSSTTLWSPSAHSPEHSLGMDVDMPLLPGGLRALPMASDQWPCYVTETFPYLPRFGRLDMTPDVFELLVEGTFEHLESLPLFATESQRVRCFARHLAESLGLCFREGSQGQEPTSGHELDPHSVGAGSGCSLTGFTGTASRSVFENEATRRRQLGRADATTPSGSPKRCDGRS